MSYKAQNSTTQAQQLKVQELVVRIADKQLYTVSGSDVIVNIGEPLTAVVQVQFQDDSAGTCAPVAAASLSIVDSTAGTAGGDTKSIKVASVTLAANDLLVLRYIANNM